MVRFPWSLDGFYTEILPDTDTTAEQPLTVIRWENVGGGGEGRTYESVVSTAFGMVDMIPMVEKHVAQIFTNRYRAKRVLDRVLDLLPEAEVLMRFRPRLFLLPHNLRQLCPFIQRPSTEPCSAPACDIVLGNGIYSSCPVEVRTGVYSKVAVSKPIVVILPREQYFPRRVLMEDSRGVQCLLHPHCREFLRYRRPLEAKRRKWRRWSESNWRRPPQLPRIDGINVNSPIL